MIRINETKSIHFRHLKLCTKWPNSRWKKTNSFHSWNWLPEHTRNKAINVSKFLSSHHFSITLNCNANLSLLLLLISKMLVNKMDVCDQAFGLWDINGQNILQFQQRLYPLFTKTQYILHHFNKNDSKNQKDTLCTCVITLLWWYYAWKHFSILIAWKQCSSSRTVQKV